MDLEPIPGDPLVPQELGYSNFEEAAGGLFSIFGAQRDEDFSVCAGKGQPFQARQGKPFAGRPWFFSDQECFHGDAIAGDGVLEGAEWIALGG